MPVTLLVPYGGYAAGATYTSDPSTEASLIAQNIATSLVASHVSTIFAPLTASEQQTVKDNLNAGFAGTQTLSAADFSALVSANGLTSGKEYYIASPPSRWIATGSNTYDGIFFQQGGVNYIGNTALATQTEYQLAAGTWATRPTTGFTAGLEYVRRMTDIGTLPGGRMMYWLGGTSTEWRAADNDAPHLGAITTAAMLAYASPTAGMTCQLTDMGNIISRWYYNGANWVPFNGEQKVFSLLADSYNTTADGTERVNTGCQFTIPPGVLAVDGMGFKYRFASQKSNAAESPIMWLRFGANGTTGDGILWGPLTMGTTTRQIGQEGAAKRASSSTLQLMGAGPITTANHRFGNTTTGARPTALSGLDFTSATYLSMTVQRTTPFAEFMLTDVFDVYITGR